MWCETRRGLFPLWAFLKPNSTVPPTTTLFNIQQRISRSTMPPTSQAPDANPESRFSTTLLAVLPGAVSLLLGLCFTYCILFLIMCLTIFNPKRNNHNQLSKPTRQEDDDEYDSTTDEISDSCRLNPNGQHSVILCFDYDSDARGLSWKTSEGEESDYEDYIRFP